MARVRKAINSTNGGELSRRMEGRTDTAIYDIGFAEMINYVPTVEGPAVKRSGFRYIRAAAAASTWLSGFVFNITQSYVLEWGENALRFYTNGGRIEVAGAAYEVATPYPAAIAPRISQQESNDRVYLAHGSYPPAALTRTGAETFAYAPLALANGPFADQNSNKGLFVYASAATGVVTLTAAAPIFKAGHVGAPFMLEAEDFSAVPAWEGGYDGITIGAKRRSDGRVYQAATAGRTGFVQPTHSQGTEYDGAVFGQDLNAKPAGGVQWAYLHDRFGMGRITAVAPDGLSATLQVTRRLPDSVLIGTWRWSHGAFSAEAGWPHLVCLWAGRLVFFKGLEIFGSVAGDYLNFASFTESGLLAPDMAFRRTLASADPPLWVKADTKLLVGTAKGELVIGAVNDNQGVSGENIQALPQSRYGSAAVWPVDIGTATLFVGRGGRKIREAEYSFERDKFVAVNINVWSRHITASGVKQLAFQQEPEEMLWGVRGDGMLIAHPHASEQQIKGFARSPLGAGLVRSAVVIPSEDGGSDELWILADRAGVKGVLRLEDWWEEEGALDEEALYERQKRGFFVDWGVSYEGAPKRHFSQGLEHLAGLEVAVLADGGVVSGCSVSAAGVLEPDLPYDAGIVHIGIRYEASMVPMRPEVRNRDGTIQGLRKRIVRLVARLLDTLGIEVSTDVSEYTRLIDRPGSAKMDRPVPLYSGDTENKAVGGGYDRAGQPRIVSREPLPSIVPMIMLELEVE